MMVHQKKRQPLVHDTLSDKTLGAIPVSVRDLFASRGEQVVVESPRVLTRAREVPHYAHFLISGAASLVTVLRDGRGIQSCLLGPGSLIEAYHLLGAAQVFTEVVMEIKGDAVRLPFSELRALFDNSDCVRRMVLSQIQNHGLVANQLVACSYYHELEPRLASLLLLLRGHALDTRFYLTQEFLANMLGVRRTTLTGAAGRLQRLGLIRYSRGQIEVQKEEGLAQLACECYGVIRTINSHCRLP